MVGVWVVVGRVRLPVHRAIGLPRRRRRGRTGQVACRRNFGRVCWPSVWSGEDAAFAGSASPGTPEARRTGGQRSWRGSVTDKEGVVKRGAGRGWGRAEQILRKWSSARRKQVSRR